MTFPSPSPLDALASPETPLDHAYALCSKTLPNGLFTAMRFHADRMEVERLYSTLPDVYPVSGRKPKKDTPWGQKVLIDRHINLGFGPEDIGWAFSDHETILGLGLQSVMNVPVVRAETVLGTINFLRKDEPFSNEEAATAQLMAALLACRGLQP